MQSHGSSRSRGQLIDAQLANTGAPPSGVASNNCCKYVSGAVS